MVLLTFAYKKITQRTYVDRGISLVSESRSLRDIIYFYKKVHLASKLVPYEFDITQLRSDKDVRTKIKECLKIGGICAETLTGNSKSNHDISKAIYEK